MPLPKTEILGELQTCLMERGVHLTSQRQAILQIVEMATKHLGASQILRKAFTFGILYCFLAATRWPASPLHSRGLTISSSEPNSFAVRIGGRFRPGSWQSSLSRSLLGTRRAVEDHAMQSAAFQGGASCIKDSAAFSFDEPQVRDFLHLQA